MADPTNGLTPEVWTILFGGIGTAVAAFAVRMGWKSGGKEIESPSQVAEIKSAIVDSSSVKLLTASIEGLGFNLLEFKKLNNDNTDENRKLVEKLIDAIDHQTSEIRDLAREIREHAREVAKK